MTELLDHPLRPAEGTSWDALLALDAERVWHPYGALPAAMPSLPVVSAEGVRLRLADGRELIDGMASWWCAIHGYRHPALDEAVRDAARPHGARDVRRPHARARRAARRAAHRAGARRASSTSSSPTRARSRSRSRSSSRCSTSALAGRPGRTRLLTVRGGYHGDTIGAMAVCDPVGGMHSMFAGVLPEHVFAPRPPDGFDAPLDAAWADAVARAGGRARGELAAVIAEPVVQGAGRHALPLARVRAAAARGLRRARPAADPRRDRHRVRALRRACSPASTRASRRT